MGGETTLKPKIIKRKKPELIKRKKADAKPKSKTFRETNYVVPKPAKTKPEPTTAEIKRRLYDFIVDLWSDHYKKMSDELGFANLKGNEPEVINAITEGQREAEASKLSKKIKQALIDVTEDFENSFKRLLAKRESLYPMEWMNKNRKIKATMKRYPLLIPLLNFIDQKNRYIRGDDLKQMAQLGDSVSAGQKHKGYQYADFVVDQQFYAEFRKYANTDTSDRQLRRYIEKLTSDKILIKRGRVLKSGFIYADGYYYKAGNVGKIKRVFLVQKRHQQAFETFELPR